MSAQIVLITGANQGLGYLAALQLSKLPGYHIFVGARTANKGAEAVKNIQAEGATSKVEPILVDVDSDKSIDAAMKQIKTKFGRLDVLVVSTSSAFPLRLLYLTFSRIMRPSLAGRGTQSANAWPRSTTQTSSE
jgi:NAD(P)-dependent dehydrogenase (short-subunit alcohol dehydrogenase family)